MSLPFVFQVVDTPMGEPDAHSLAMAATWYMVFAVVVVAWWAVVRSCFKSRAEVLRKIVLPPVDERDLPPYPDTWYHVSTTDFIEKQMPYLYTLAETDLVVWHGASGKYAAVDRRCPALGLDLLQARLDGEELVCTQPDGAVYRVNALGQVTNAKGDVVAAAALRSYPTAHANRSVYVFRSMKPGVPGEQPVWQPYEVAWLKEDTFDFLNHHVSTVHCHIQDIAENGADFAHLNCVHTQFVIDWPLLRWLTHHWGGTWRVGDPEKNECPAHAYMTVEMTMKGFGKHLPGSAAYTLVVQDGLGNAYLHIETGLGKFMIVQTVVPVGIRKLECHHYMYTQHRVPVLRDVIGAVALKMMVGQFLHDLPIWNNKRFNSRPMVVKGDGPLLAYRRYCRQFYPGVTLANSGAADDEKQQADDRVTA